MSVASSLQSCKEFLIGSFASLVNRGKITVQEYESAKDLVSGYSASWLATDSTDIVVLCDNVYSAMQSGSLSGIAPEVKNDIVSLLAQIKTTVGNSEGYGIFVVVSEQAIEVAKQTGSTLESVSADIADMSIPYAIVGGVLGVVVAPLLVASVPLATVTVPVAGAVAGYSSKKIQNFAESVKAKVRGWF